MIKKFMLYTLIICTISILISNDGYPMRRYKLGEQLEIYKKEGKSFIDFGGLIIV